MGTNVFGTPITEEYLREVRDGRSGTQNDRARMALLMKNEDGKDINARTFIDAVYDKYGRKACCKCLIYNATGDPLTYVAEKHWRGCVSEYPFPMVIQNGQWGALLHNQSYGGEETSKAAVVYSGNNAAGDECYWIMFFCSTSSGSYNQVYTEICKPSDYNNTNDFWSSFNQNLPPLNEMSVYKAEQNQGLLFGSIGNVSSAKFEAILTLPEALQ